MQGFTKEKARQSEDRRDLEAGKSRFYSARIRQPHGLLQLGAGSCLAARPVDLGGHLVEPCHHAGALIGVCEYRPRFGRFSVDFKG